MKQRLSAHLTFFQLSHLSVYIMSTSSRSSRHQKSSSLNRASIAAQKTEITIHVYDLLPVYFPSSLVCVMGMADRDLSRAVYPRCSGLSEAHYYIPELLSMEKSMRMEVMTGKVSLASTTPSLVCFRQGAPSDVRCYTASPFTPSKSSTTSLTRCASSSHW